MQYNHIFTLKKIRNTPLLSAFLKALIFIIVAAYLLFSIKNKDAFDSDFKNSLLRVIDAYGYLLLIPLILFPVNWGLEAMKWKFLTGKIEKISFLKSFRGVITGVTLGFATPLGLGDYVGRILQLKKPDRARGVGAVFVSRIAQFYITLACGSSSLIVLAHQTNTKGYFDDTFDVFLALILVINILFLLLFLFQKNILAMLRNLKIFKRIYPYIDIIDQYSFRALAYVLALSLARYFIFTGQFILILYFFGVSTDLRILLSGVNFIFLAKSVVPTLFDLGVREGAAVYFFSNFTHSTDQVIFASLTLWAINILLPAFIGLFFIFKLKIFTRP